MPLLWIIFERRVQCGWYGGKNQKCWDWRSGIPPDLESARREEEVDGGLKRASQWNRLSGIRDLMRNVRIDKSMSSKMRNSKWKKILLTYKTRVTHFCSPSRLCIELLSLTPARYLPLILRIPMISFPRASLLISNR